MATVTEQLCRALGREPVEDEELDAEAAAWLARRAEDVELLLTLPEPRKPSFAMIERGEWLIERVGLERVRVAARSAPSLYGPLYRRAAGARGLEGVLEELEGAFDVQEARRAAIPWVRAFEPTAGVAARLAAAIVRQLRAGPVEEAGELVERHLPRCRLGELFDVCDRIVPASPAELLWGDGMHVSTSSLPTCALGVAVDSGQDGALEACLSSPSRSELSVRTALWVASRLEPTEGGRRARIEALEGLARRRRELVMDEVWLEACVLARGSIEATHPGRSLRIVREAGEGWERALRRLVPREPWLAERGELEVAAVALLAVAASGRRLPGPGACGTFLARSADDGGHGGALFAAAWGEPRLRAAVSEALCGALGSGAIGRLRRRLGVGDEHHAVFLREVVSRAQSHEVGLLMDVEELRAALAVLPEVGLAECAMLLLSVTIDEEFGAFLDGFVRLHAAEDARVPQQLGPYYQTRWMRTALRSAGRRRGEA